MANNQNVNKVQYGNTTLIDLTSDTVTADTLLSGYTAHDASGAQITGTASAGTIDGDLDVTGNATVGGSISAGGEVSATDSNDAVHNLTGKVSKSGDTMTGDLVMDDSEILITTEAIDISGSAPASTIYGKSMKFRDKDGDTIFSIVPNHTDAGATEMMIVLHNYVNGANNSSWLRYTQDSSGISYINDHRMWNYPSFDPNVLYNNTSGTNGTVSLSRSATNYDHMRIYYYGKSGATTAYKRYDSTDVYDPNGKYVSLAAVSPQSPTSTSVDISCKVVLVSGSQITTERATAGNVQSSPGAGIYNEIYITRVEAWNE